MGKELTEVLDYLENEAQKILEKEDFDETAEAQIRMLSNIRNEVLRIGGIRGESY